MGNSKIKPAQSLDDKPFNLVRNQSEKLRNLLIKLIRNIDEKSFNLIK